MEIFKKHAKIISENGFISVEKGSIMDISKRQAGVLRPVSSLPSQHGIGTFGKEAYQFVDFLSESGQSYWQMLPLNVTAYGDSPYQSPSSTGLNYYFIDLDRLREKGLLTKQEIDSSGLDDDGKRVNYGNLFDKRIPLLKKAYSRFDTKDSRFRLFVADKGFNDFAFYRTRKERFHYRPWYEWDEEYKTYSPELEEKIKKEHKDTYLFYVWTQYEVLSQYKALKKYANSKGIKIIGDRPIYLARDSVEVYKYPHLFRLDEKHNPTVVAGVPPDCFSADGQLWGNPIYDWDERKKDNYSWFHQRIDHNLTIFDVLRIDHFRGFADYYAIPYGEKTARNGKWVRGPGEKLFEGRKNLSIIAEDLGTLDEPVKNLRKTVGYPGRKVLQFAFDGDRNNPRRPSKTSENTVCYTGTHDNEPRKGYLDHLSPEQLNVFKQGVKEECDLYHVDYKDDTLENLTRTLDSLCYAGPSFSAIVPIQDILALGDFSRINHPSTLSTDNWSYRTSKEDFSDEVKEFLLANAKKYNRI